MNYNQTLEYIFYSFPIFQNIGLKAYNNKLDKITDICNSLNNPQHNFKSIHIAGTNGKGSTSHQLAAILSNAGYKTALFTSPHLVDFRERIRIDGITVSEDFVISFIEKNKDLFDEVKPSFFEMTTAMAFEYFSSQKVDIAIIETGLGGRLDATNIINPILSIITNISIDHTNVLGKTISEIATEKAGIIKNNIPVIISKYQEEISDVFIKKANSCNSDIIFAEKEWDITNFYSSLDYISFFIKNKTVEYKDLKLDLIGDYQQMNIKGVLSAVLKLKDLGYNITEQNLREALFSVQIKTGLRGRFQILNKQPLAICDTGHNVDGISQIVKQITKYNYDKLYFVIGMVSDKDIDAVLKILPQKAYYLFCKANINRAMDSMILKEKAQGFGLVGESCGSVSEAYQKAKDVATEKDLIFIGGSTFVVAEVL